MINTGGERGDGEEASSYFLLTSRAAPNGVREEMEQPFEGERSGKDANSGFPGEGMIFHPAPTFLGRFLKTKIKILNFEF